MAAFWWALSARVRAQAGQSSAGLFIKQAVLHDPFYRREHRNKKWLSNLPKALKPEWKSRLLESQMSSLLYLLPINLCPQGKQVGLPATAPQSPLVFSPFQVGVRVMSAQSNKSLLTFPVEITIDSMQGKNWYREILYPFHMYIYNRLHTDTLLGAGVTKTRLPLLLKTLEASGEHINT